MLYLNNIKCRFCKQNTVYIECQELGQLDQNIVTEKQLEDFSQSPPSLFVCGSCGVVWLEKIKTLKIRQTTIEEFLMQRAIVE